MASHSTYCKENAHHGADVADPGLDPSVAQNTLRISIFYAYSSVEHPDPTSEEYGRLAEQLPPMVRPAMEIIRYISASNWSICHGIWKQHLGSCSNAEGKGDVRPLKMIDNLNLDSETLTAVIKGPHPRLRSVF
jgi:hypothetical protein